MCVLAVLLSFCCAGAAARQPERESRETPRHRTHTSHLTGYEYRPPHAVARTSHARININRKRREARARASVHTRQIDQVRTTSPRVSRTLSPALLRNGAHSAPSRTGSDALREDLKARRERVAPWKGPEAHLVLLDQHLVMSPRLAAGRVFRLGPIIIADDGARDDQPVGRQPLERLDGGGVDIAVNVDVQSGPHPTP
eukprot:1743224-Prymnesium_polylepis.1